MPLADSTIKSAKPKEKPYKLSDAQGLYIEVTSSGSKLWRLKYRIDGKEKRLALGAYPAVSLLKARQGRDSARQYLDKDILPIIGERPVTAITRPELVTLVREVEKRAAFNVAAKMRQWLGQIFRFGRAKGVVEHSPATDLNIVAEHGPRTQHYPHVPFAELPELLKAVEASNVHLLTKHAINLLLLLAVRPGEMRHALWNEFDLDAALWTIPAERMKARRPHLVPLPRQAVALLRQIHEITGTYPLYSPDQPALSGP